MRYMYVIMSLWFFSGCGNDFDRTKPYIMNQKSTPLPTEKYDANRPDPHYASTIESAKIAAEKELQTHLEIEIKAMYDKLLFQYKRDSDFRR